MVLLDGALGVTVRVTVLDRTGAADSVDVIKMVAGPTELPADSDAEAI